jgi:hypothetical protein
MSQIEKHYEKIAEWAGTFSLSTGEVKIKEKKILLRRKE